VANPYDFDDPDAFFVEGELAEWVIYLPRTGSSEITRRILVIVEVIDLWVRTGALNGIRLPDTGGDRLKFARRQGLDPEEMMIGEILGDSTPQVWHLRMR
jgi:hypothetical protein